MDDVFGGFPGIGEMPEINKAIQPNYRLHLEMSVEEVHERRDVNNELVLSKIDKFDEMGPLLLQKSQADAEKG